MAPKTPAADQTGPASIQGMVIMDNTKTGPDQAPDLWTALADYRAALARLRGIKPCLSHWPGDPPGPDTVGTSCDLLDGHDEGPMATPHRHHIKGSAVVVTW